MKFANGHNSVKKIGGVSVFDLVTSFDDALCLNQCS